VNFFYATLNSTRKRERKTHMSGELPPVRPDDVLKMTKPATTFLCKLSANTYGIEFLKFTIRDMASGTVLYDVERRPDAPKPTPAQLAQLPPEMEMAVRSIRYQFPPQFLRLKTVGAKLVFSVGPNPVSNFRMIERHYFREKLIKSFDFTFGFCIPGSTNSWEAIYDMPKLTPEEETEIVNHPYQTRSDSFYFVDNVLVMHNKAEYAYNLAVQQQQGSAPAAPAGTTTQVQAA
jgi:hypothetical protein